VLAQFRLGSYQHGASHWRAPYKRIHIHVIKRVCSWLLRNSRVLQRATPTIAARSVNKKFPRVGSLLNLPSAMTIKWIFQNFYRVAKAHWMPYLDKSFSAKDMSFSTNEPYNWLTITAEGNTHDRCSLSFDLGAINMARHIVKTPPENEMSDHEPWRSLVWIFFIGLFWFM